MDTYTACSKRYKKIEYKRCGNSGLKLPLISLGLWHNFGDVDSFENGREILRAAFDSVLLTLTWPITMVLHRFS
jgi:L-glyceraldehyde 3-phosphate reductase